MEKKIESALETGSPEESVSSGISRRILIAALREPQRNIEDNIALCIETLAPVLKDNMSESEMSDLRKLLTTMRSNYMTRMKSCNQTYSRFEQKYADWLSGDFLVPSSLLKIRHDLEEQIGRAHV